MPELPQSPQAAQSAPGTGQPSFGSSPATGPTQNAGHQAMGVKGLGVAVDGLVQVLALVGPNSPIGADITKSIQTLAKHVPPGAVTPQDKMQIYQRLMLQAQQGVQQMQQMQQKMAQQQPQQAAPQMPQQQAA